ncbi:hypothetical protein XENOCAPTIV_018426 [Xenoophorus captivus]|uniref:Uncharacterized protein n=1 Tax=Xenoophorus captivus TaxID=1517983 RepID=A0ABV0RRF8_9TELE
MLHQMVTGYVKNQMMMLFPQSPVCPLFCVRSVSCQTFSTPFRLLCIIVHIRYCHIVYSEKIPKLCNYFKINVIKKTSTKTDRGPDVPETALFALFVFVFV